MATHTETEVKQIQETALEHLWIYMSEPSDMAKKGMPQIFVEGKGVHVTDALGRTYIDTMALGRMASMPKQDYEPLLPGVFHAPQPLPYRCEYGGTTPEECAEHCIWAIEDIIKLQGPDTIPVVVAEPVSSPMGGN